jgi:nitroimidazol reductase NimA-like FMN-containing flavoprotein (pyridoxamine 5'-phosphate oxidase superfamily)
MTKEEIRKLIMEQVLCRIAFKGSNYPYIAPFQYIMMNDSLYFHLTNYGRKIRLLKKDIRVCVEIEKYEPDLSKYSFVVLRGKLKTVIDHKERAEAIRRLADLGKNRISEKFLAAHGLKSKDGWSSLTPERAQIIFKLDEITEEIGIKSP